MHLLMLLIICYLKVKIEFYFIVDCWIVFIEFLEIYLLWIKSERIIVIVDILEIYLSERIIISFGYNIMHAFGYAINYLFPQLIVFVEFLEIYLSWIKSRIIVSSIRQANLKKSLMSNTS